MTFTTILRIALALGFFIDGLVGVVCLFAPGLVQPLFDIPVKDATALSITGGEFVVVALLYAMLFRDPWRFRPALWVCALDQAFAVVLPLLAVATGTFPATFKVIAPIPLSAALTAVYVVGALRDTTRSPA